MNIRAISRDASGYILSPYVGSGANPRASLAVKIKKANHCLENKTTTNLSHWTHCKEA
jgi:hypothetical protein